MTFGYLLGLVTIPALIGGGWLLWQLLRLLNRAGDALAKRLPVGRADERAGFAAFAASTRRAHVFVFGGVGIAVFAGYDGSNARKVYDAVYGVLAQPARVGRRWRARTHDDPGAAANPERIP
ncbi:hypothetical protein [Verrucosispora sp. TAA-831]|uniref:hypothetical protein n=1 Tax=Verrucosispora sp. TAA-831 TaxID=3422227 RepID=UPI003D6E9390